jgi:2-iminobutanoate/2-iminopropanoate deaminase
MSKHAISSPSAPKAVGPYSQGIRTGDFIFLAGQIPLDPATGELVTGDISAQTRRCLENIKALLAAEGATCANVVKATVFLTDLANFAAMNAVYAEYFTELPPARSTIQVAGLPKASMVEIEVVARTA